MQCALRCCIARATLTWLAGRSSAGEAAAWGEKGPLSSSSSSYADGGACGDFPIGALTCVLLCRPSGKGVQRLRCKHLLHPQAETRARRAACAGDQKRKVFGSLLRARMRDPMHSWRVSRARTLYTAGLEQWQDEGEAASALGSVQIFCKDAWRACVVAAGGSESGAGRRRDSGRGLGAGSIGLSGTTTINSPERMARKTRDPRPKTTTNLGSKSSTESAEI